jgi:hypothetical protein
LFKKGGIIPCLFKTSTKGGIVACPFMTSIKKSKNLKDNYACNLLFVSTLYVNEIWKTKQKWLP